MCFDAPKNMDKIKPLHKDYIWESSNDIDTMLFWFVNFRLIGQVVECFFRRIILKINVAAVGYFPPQGYFLQFLLHYYVDLYPRSVS